MATRETWLKERLNGIGASEAAAIVNQSPWMDNLKLWEIKTGRKTPDDIGDNPIVKYGNDAEKPLRDLFKLDHPQYKVTYKPFDVVRNKKYPFIFATLDGRLKDQNGRKGVYEGKTTEARNGQAWDKWRDRIPDNYYVQILHQLLASGFEFSVLKAQIKFTNENGLCALVRHYHFERATITDDLEFLLEAEIKFWESVTAGKRPNLTLPNI